MHLTLSKLNALKFRRAKCIGDILFQIEESDKLEAASATPSQYHAHGRYSPAPSLSSYSSNENHSYQQGMPVAHESMNMLWNTIYGILLRHKDTVMFLA